MREANKMGQGDVRLCPTQQNKIKQKNLKSGTEANVPTVPCPVEKQCGGCQYLRMPYEEQLKLKQEKIQKLLKPFGKVYEITGADDPYHYRNKVHAVFGRTKNGQIISGTYQQNTHRIVPVDECLIENEKADAIIRSIRELLASFRIKTYDEDTGYGVFRHALVRTAYKTGQILVVLVTGTPVFPSRNNFVKALLALHPEITTIVHNINDKRTSMVLGERETVLYGKGFIEDELCGLRFRISSGSFYQINSAQTEKLYRKAISLAGLTGKERVIDAYCGIGTIGLTAAGSAKEVIGVELNRKAVQDARKNAERNGIRNARFFPGDAGEFMVRMASEKEHADVVIMDPPRSGSSRAFLDAVKKLAPDRVVYISCGPESLARDLEILRKNGYVMQGAWPYDLFCMTEHVEVAALLERVSNRKADSYVKLNVKMEDYYRIKDSTGTGKCGGVTEDE